jgi:hypothetical protein
MGLGELLRVEITDWIVRFQSDGKTYRYPPAARSRLSVVENRTLQKVYSPPKPVEAEAIEAPDTIPASTPAPTTSSRSKEDVLTEPPQLSSETPDHTQAAMAAASSWDCRRASQTIESLRNGLPPVHADVRPLAVGFERTAEHITNLLNDVAIEGGRAMVLKGAYGQGKTYALNLLEEIALEEGFAVVKTEIDATENRLNKPHHIYRDLLAHLRLPEVKGTGRMALSALVERGLREVREATHSVTNPEQWCEAAYWILNKELGCKSLAWLLSDPNVVEKRELLGLLQCDPGVHITQARQHHCLAGGPREWPAFSAGTQGDFASYLLSGISRLCRYVGYKGLIVVLDEMEKWQDLNWQEQSQAGNLLGGLIWGATAELGQRERANEPAAIRHSLRGGGFPFTTASRSHMGIAIAMTPRLTGGPEQLWQAYGLLEIANLPHLTDRLLAQYCSKVAPHYAMAYGRPIPTRAELTRIVHHTVRTWKRGGQLNTRSGVQAAIEAFDAWRGCV